MNTITISFTHPRAKQPTYIFGDRVAAKSDLKPEAWATGKVVGLYLEEFKSRRATWVYFVKLDSPLACMEEYEVDYLVSEADIPTLQAKWNAGVEA